MMNDMDIGSRKDEYIIVFKSYNRALIAFAKSLLDQNDIEYFVRNEIINNTFGSGVLIGVEPGLDPVEIWVRNDDEKKAKVIIDDLLI